jgi:hypothetical protein
LDEWLEKLNIILSSVKWNNALTIVIQDYLNHTDFTQESVDALLMSVTKLVETSLRDAVAKYIQATVPRESSYGTNLLNYAKTKGFIPQPKKGSDFIYCLMYWYFEKPRNLCHHFFADFPLPTYITIVSTANFILNEIERLSNEKNYFTAKTNIDYNQASEQLCISVAEIRKADLEDIIPSALEMNLINPDKSTKVYPLQYTGGEWNLQMSTEGLMPGTYSVNLVGRTKEEKFNISSGSALVTMM